MENQKRGMAATGQELPPVKRKARSENRVTVMIMRSVGRVRSFKISPRIVFWASLFVVVYISLSVYFTTEYIKYCYIHHQDGTQNNEIKRLERDLVKSRKEHLRSKQHLALLEDYIQNLEKRMEQEKEPLKYADIKEPKPPQRVVSQPVERIEVEKPSEVIDIKDMVIQTVHARVTVSFKLVNIQPGESSVGGYIHVIATGRDANPRQEWTYPTEKLKNGVPMNFRRGLPFLIQRFKPYTCFFNADSNSQLPTAIKIMAYDQAGELTLEKEFEVSNES